MPHHAYCSSCRWYRDYSYASVCNAPRTRQVVHDWLGERIRLPACDVKNRLNDCPDWQRSRALIGIVTVGIFSLLLAWLLV